MPLPESGFSQLSDRLLEAARLLLVGEHITEQELEHSEEAGKVYVCEA